MWWLNEHYGVLRGQSKPTIKDQRVKKGLENVKEMIKSLGGNHSHMKVILKAAQEFQVDPVFITSVVSVESTFRLRGMSTRSAKGLMQIRSVVIETIGVTDPWDSYESIMAVTAYLRHCFKRHAKHRHSNFLALAAYKIGPNKPEKLLRSAAGRCFVKKVLKVYNRYTSVPITIKREFLVKLDRHRD